MQEWWAGELIALAYAHCSGKSKSAEQWYDNAKKSDYEWRFTSPFKLLNVCCKSCGEHQHDNANFWQFWDELSFFYNIKNGRSEYLRQFHFLCYKSENFGRKQYKCNKQYVAVFFHDFTSFPRRHYMTLMRKNNDLQHFTLCKSSLIFRILL